MTTTRFSMTFSLPARSSGFRRPGQKDGAGASQQRHTAGDRWLGAHGEFSAESAPFSAPADDDVHENTHRKQPHQALRARGGSGRAQLRGEAGPGHGLPGPVTGLARSPRRCESCWAWPGRLRSRATIGASRTGSCASRPALSAQLSTVWGSTPSRSAVQHLRVLASAGGIDRARVDEVIALVGLAEAANRSVGGFSLGMRQRLNLAGASLGDPEGLIFDEPLNGLDPEGIRWVRELLPHLAAQGRTVLLSSHLLAEVSNTVDDVVVIANGRLVCQSSLADLSYGTDLEQAFFDLVNHQPQEISR